MSFKSLILFIAFLLAACAPTVMTKPGTAVDQSAQLQTSLDQIVRENQEACKREEYKPLYLKSACKVSEITDKQVSDTSRMSAAEKSPFPNFRSESQARSKKVAAAYRTYGGAQGIEAALVIERTGGLLDKAAQDLYEETITWGGYSKRRKDIQQLYLDEFEKIASPKSK